MQQGWQTPFPALLNPVRLIKGFSLSVQIFKGEGYKNKI